MKVKVKEAIGVDLDWMVGVVTGMATDKRLDDHFPDTLPIEFQHQHDLTFMWEVDSIMAGDIVLNGIGPREMKDIAMHLGYCIDRPCAPAYSSDMAIGAALISEQKISVDYDDSRPPHLRCRARIFRSDSQSKESQSLEAAEVCEYGSDMLEAGLRCYVKAALGEECEVPEELEISQFQADVMRGSFDRMRAG
jgi:hypothetical protein